ALTMSWLTSSPTAIYSYFVTCYVVVDVTLYVNPSVSVKNILRFRKNGLPHTVVGVMPPGFWPVNSTIPRIWIPYFFSAEEKTNRKGGGWNVIARLRPVVSFDEAQTEMDLIAAQLEADYPEHNRNKGIVLIPSAANLTAPLGGFGRLFLLLLCA